MKTAVVYWSGTGNTEAMARAVAEGMTAAGAEAVLLTPAEVAPGDLNTYGAIAFGCPAMGSEVLEEMEFQPMFDAGFHVRMGAFCHVQKLLAACCRSPPCFLPLCSHKISSMYGVRIPLNIIFHIFEGNHRLELAKSAF